MRQVKWTMAWVYDVARWEMHHVAIAEIDGKSFRASKRLELDEWLGDVFYAASQAAGAVQRMTDPRGTEHNVVLTIPPGQPSTTRKAVWESTTTYKFTQHYLRPETMVRQEQGQEIWAAYRGRCPFRGPVTFDEFMKMVQQRGSASAAPPQPQGSGLDPWQNVSSGSKSPAELSRRTRRARQHQRQPQRRQRRRKQSSGFAGCQHGAQHVVRICAWNQRDAPFAHSQIQPRATR
jgi:hypothetical protein